MHRIAHVHWQHLNWLENMGSWRFVDILVKRHFMLQCLTGRSHICAPFGCICSDDESPIDLRSPGLLPAGYAQRCCDIVSAQRLQPGQREGLGKPWMRAHNRKVCWKVHSIRISHLNPQIIAKSLVIAQARLRDPGDTGPGVVQLGMRCTSPKFPHGK